MKGLLIETLFRRRPTEDRGEFVLVIGNEEVARCATFDEVMVRAENFCRTPKATWAEIGVVDPYSRRSQHVSVEVWQAADFDDYDEGDGPLGMVWLDEEGWANADE